MVAQTDLVLPDRPGSGRGRRHGTSSSEPFDRWFRYPAGFASDYATLLLGQACLQPGGVIIDPFAGSGVTGTAARHAGFEFFGIETHPLVAELAQLKVAPKPPMPLYDLTAFVEDLAKRAGKRPVKAQALIDEPDLVRQSFDADTLRQLITFRNLLKNNQGSPWYKYAKWALLGALRDVASVSVGWPYQRPTRTRQPRFGDVSRRIAQRAQVIADDLNTLGQPLSGQPATVFCGDARQSTSWSTCPSTQPSASISSPPYLNNFDYADATRLELYFWGEVTTWKSMCDQVRAGMITATTQQSTIDSARRATESLGRYDAVNHEVQEIIQRLSKERAARKRGKEYDRVVPDYFSGIAAVLANLSGATAIGSRCLWLIGDSAPYGVYIDTPRIIGQIAESVGFRVLEDRILRHRGGRWATNSTRHSVELSERLLVFQRAK